MVEALDLSLLQPLRLIVMNRMNAVPTSYEII